MEYFLPSQQRFGIPFYFTYTHRLYFCLCGSWVFLFFFTSFIYHNICHFLFPFMCEPCVCQCNDGTYNALSINKHIIHGILKSCDSRMEKKNNICLVYKNSFRRFSICTFFRCLMYIHPSIVLYTINHIIHTNIARQFRLKV